MRLFGKSPKKRGLPMGSFRRNIDAQEAIQAELRAVHGSIEQCSKVGRRVGKLWETYGKPMGILKEDDFFLEAMGVFFLFFFLGGVWSFFLGGGKMGRCWAFLV